MKLLLSILLLFISININAKELKEYQVKQFQLAISYENTGDYEKAAEIVNELWAENDENQELFDAYIRIYSFLHKYSEIKQVADKFSTTHPSLNNYSISAVLSWKTGDFNKSDLYWQKALKTSENDPKTYEYIAKELIKLKQYEKAIEFLIKGRYKLKNSVLFADLLSRYYALTGDYKNGFKEILLLAHNPKTVNLAKGRLYAYTNMEEGKKFFVQEFKNSLDKERNPFILDLFAWFLRITKQYGEAFDVYLEIDILRHSNGRELYNFANYSRKDAQFKPAIKAFNYIINNIDKSPFKVNALYGLSRTLEQQLVESDSINNKDIKNIIKKYDMIYKEFNKTQYADQALYRAAVLNYEYLNNINDAIKRLESLKKTARNKQYKAKASIMLGNIHLSLEKLEQAKFHYRDAVKVSNINKDDRDLALYQMGMIEYFTGDVDTAKIIFDSFKKNPNSLKTNDALEKSGFIESNKSQISAFNLYRKAEFMEFMKKSSLSIELYIESSEKATNEEFAQLSLKKASGLLMNEKKYNEASELFFQIINDYPKGLYNDYAYLKIGDIYRINKENKEAEKYYLKLLVEFPHSIYLDEVRKKARAIRGNR